MGTPAVGNVLKTGAALWYAPSGETKPDETSVAFGAAWGGNWARVGYTKEPVKLKYESTEYDIEVQEELAAVDRKRTKEAATIETVLAEFTAAYLRLVGGDQDSVTTTAAGSGQKGYEYTGLGGVATIGKHAWGFEGEFVDSAGVSQPVRFFIHIGTAMINGDLEFSQKTDDYVGMPVQIKALTDTTQAAGEKLVLMQRVTAAATT